MTRVLQRRLLSCLLTTAALLTAANAHAQSAPAPGSLVRWGDTAGTLATGNDFTAISAGFSHGLGLRADGSLAGWGPEGTNGEYFVPSGNDFVAIDGSLALREDGSLVAFGPNNAGQLDVPAGNDFVAISAAGASNLALRADGSLVAWGDNSDGQRHVPAGNDFVAISAGGRHSLALRADGSLVGWGENTYGQTAVSDDGNDFVAIAAGFLYSLALRADGSIVYWGGDNFFGNEFPHDVPAGNDFVAIAAGTFHALALRNDGTLVGWGQNTHGQTDVPEGTFVAISAGFRHSLAIAGPPPNSPPEANAGADQTVECTSPSGASVTLQGSGSDPDGDELTFNWDVPDGIVLDDPSSPTPSGVFPIGVTVAILTVTDGNGGVDCDEVSITVVDSHPPEVACSTDTPALFPPNHRMVEVGVFVAATDACTAPGSLQLVSVLVTLNEPDNGLGDGDTAGDVNGQNGYTSPVNITSAFSYSAATEGFQGSVNLRAERSGEGVGRSYTIEATVIDTAGNTAVTSCVVVVPHDRRKK